MLIEVEDWNTLNTTRTLSNGRRGGKGEKAPEANIYTHTYIYFQKKHRRGCGPKPREDIMTKLWAKKEREARRC